MTTGKSGRRTRIIGREKYTSIAWTRTKAEADKYKGSVHRVLRGRNAKGEMGWLIYKKGFHI
jgi:hypothetical protein